MDTLREPENHGGRYPVEPGYVADASSVLRADPKFVHALGLVDSRDLVTEFVIPIRTGRAWLVPAGHVCRFTTIEGPQVLDVNLWSAHNPRERFWASRTRQFYGAHVSVGDRLWSCLPFLRPLATIVGDSIDYGVDEDGAGCHDLLGTRCDPYVNQLLSGKAYDFNCHSNLVRAVMPFGLTEYDVHDVINVFQVTGLMPDDERYFMKPSPARAGDHFDLFAETDLLIAASTCPGGDLSVPMWGPNAGGEPICRPIQVSLYSVNESFLEAWSPSVVANYAGAKELRHGLRSPACHPSFQAGSRTVHAVKPARSWSG